MNQNPEEINEIIARWLAGEASAKDLEALNMWSEENNNNRKYLKQMEKIWDTAAESASNSNTQAAWNAVQNQIISKSNIQPKLRIIYRASFAIAAALGLFFAGRFLFNPGQKTTDNLPVTAGLFIQAGNEAYTTTLPDETVVILQAHSTLTADSGFGKTNRKLILKGSAHFNTKHGHKHYFVVQTAQTTITDIGTSFWVRNTQNETLIAVTQGSVKIEAFSDSATLQFGDSAIVSRLEEKLKTIANKTTLKVEEIKDKTLVFLKTELKKVTQLLNNTYSSDIRLGNPAIANCKLTASFKNESLENVLEIIRETFNLEIRKEGNVIYLEGKGCQ